jgi:hypothetical protein
MDRVCSAGTVWRFVFIGTAGAILLLAQDGGASDKAVFAGKVADSVTDQAVAQAAVRLMPLKPGQPGYSGRAGVDGQFRFEYRPAGGWYS